MINAYVYVCSTLLTYIFGIISKKTGHNKVLPIPIQNIVIGISCFVATLLTFYITKQPYDVENIIQQIILALGGAGTATLCYDASKINKE